MTRPRRNLAQAVPAQPQQPLSPAVIAIIDDLAHAHAAQDNAREAAAMLARLDLIMQGFEETEWPGEK